MGVGRRMGEVVLSHAFSFVIFWILKTRTVKPEKRGFSLNAPKNVFQWWVCSFEVILPRGQISILPPNHFHWAD